MINIFLFLESFAMQLAASLVGLFILFFIFEIAPIPFIKENTIKKNFPDFLRYHVLRSLFAVSVATFFVIIIYSLNLAKGLIDITNLSHISQAIIIYFFAELIIYYAHMSAHKYKIPLLSNAHKFHHTVRDDMEWVNSKKEHLLVISLFMLIFSVLFFSIFKSSPLSHVLVTSTYLLLNSFSHYRKKITLPYFDYFFLFPKDHLRHHTERSGPYGVTLSVFDTIFNTRK